MTKTNFELSPVDGRKSFYGKAKVFIDNNTGIKFLQSYNTIVCSIDSNGVVRRLWSGYSVTTMRHINAFLAACSVVGGGKKWWDSQEVA